MKKAIVILFILVFAGMAFAVTPVNHTAKLLPAKGMLIAGSTSTSLTTISGEFTYGLNRANIHAKLNFAGGRVHFEGLMQHYLFDWNTIDMGFSSGGHIFFGTARLEISAVGMWNMSYQLAENVAFYGGLKYKIGYGISWGTGFLVNRLNLFLGTEIELIKNLKLFLEVQPNIYADTRGVNLNGAFFGVNYYFPDKSEKVEIPDA
ncbi:MAG: hypothetical protein J7M01_00410 [Candidatus Marinimicrobia bacterium]|nr:hypothetical protein [Candidatus Neomarinimicrobiota bacterium]